MPPTTETSNRGATFIAGAAILLTLLLAAWSMIRTKTGDLLLSVNVPGASVLVDGIQAPSSASISAGEVMLQLPAGKHIIKIQADGHEPWSDSVTIERDQPQRIGCPTRPCRRSVRNQRLLGQHTC